MQETWVQSLVGNTPWRREWLPLHILAWRIPSTEEPGRLQSMGVAESPMTEQLTLTPTQPFQKLKHPSTYIIF